jgi:hypothetical protein
MPSLLPNTDAGPERQVLQATGTDNSDTAACTKLAQADDIPQGGMRLIEASKGEGPGKGTGLKPHDLQGVEAGCQSVIPSERSSPSRIRTYNKPVNRSLTRTARWAQESLDFRENNAFRPGLQALSGACECSQKPAEIRRLGWLCRKGAEGKTAGGRCSLPLLVRTAFRFRN